MSKGISQVVRCDECQQDHAVYYGGAPENDVNFEFTCPKTMMPVILACSTAFNDAPVRPDGSLMLRKFGERISDTVVPTPIL